MVDSFGYLPLAAVNTGALFVGGAFALLAAAALCFMLFRHRNASFDTITLLSALAGAALIRGILLGHMGSEGHDDLSAAGTSASGAVSLETVQSYTSLWQAATLLQTVAMWTLASRVLRAAFLRAPQSQNPNTDRLLVMLRGFAGILPMLGALLSYKMLSSGSLGQTTCSRHGVSGEIMMGYATSKVDSEASCGDPNFWFTWLPAVVLSTAMGGTALVMDRPKWAARDSSISWVAGALMAAGLAIVSALATGEDIGANMGCAVFLSAENLLIAMVGLVVNANLELLADERAEGVDFMGIVYGVDCESQRERDQGGGGTVELSTV